MNRVIIQWSLRESAAWTIPVCLAIFGYVLFVPFPLRMVDVFLTVGAVLLGGLPAFRIFWDGGGVRPFLFSRSFSPGRLFCVRWLTGMTFVLGTWIIVSIMIGSGLRQGIQMKLFENGWFPMIRFMELKSLVLPIFVSLIVYQTTVFFVVRHRFWGLPRLKGVRFWLRQIVSVLLSICLSFVLFGVVMLVWISAFDPHSGGLTIRDLSFLFGIPALAQTVFMPIAGRICYRNMEIES